MIIRSDKMIEWKILLILNERGAVLVDTEMVMGDPIGYVGQSDNTWIMMNKDMNDFGFVITDYKSNQPKILSMPYMKNCIHHFRIIRTMLLVIIIYRYRCMGNY